MKENKYLTNFYSKDCNEDERFSKDKAHSVEYLTTRKYIDKYIKNNDRILEVGAGTGAYSIWYASLGYQVDAIELVKSNVDILKSKITKDMNINVIQGNALDLSCYKDNTFDVTLVLGPLYHLYTEEDKKKAIEEAIRVTKKDGLIYIAYINSDSIFLTQYLKKKNLLQVMKVCDKNYKMLDMQEEIFSAFYVDEFNKLMSNYNIETINSITSDGMSYVLKEYINNLTDEEFKIWIDYHYKTCERYDLQGYSTHMLHICRKK